MYAQYHEEYNHNKRITISEWNITENVAERDVVFLMPLRAPGILKRTIGESHPFATTPQIRFLAHLDLQHSISGDLTVLYFIAGTDVIRVHDQHRVTIELEDGAEQVDADVLPPLRLVTFESKPAIAPKGQADMPFAKVKFLFSNMTLPSGHSACKVRHVKIQSRLVAS